MTENSAPQLRTSGHTEALADLRDESNMRLHTMRLRIVCAKDSLDGINPATPCE